MNSRSIQLTSPLSEADVRGLRLGDEVYLSGRFFTGRSQFHMRAVDQGAAPPVDYSQANVLMHIGPVFRRHEGQWIPIGFDQTSSLRFERWEPRLITQLGIRAVIGKTTLGQGSAVVMREYGCVHLTRVGVPGNLLARSVRRVLEVHGLEEFGMTEATWVLEAERMGPFIVDMDTTGGHLFSAVADLSAAKMQALYRRFGIPEDFRYSESNSTFVNLQAVK